MAMNVGSDGDDEIINAIKVLATRAGNVAEDNARKQLAETELKERADEWAKEVSKGGRILAYEKRGPEKDKTVALIKAPGLQAWDNWTVPMSMRSQGRHVVLLSAGPILPLQCE